MGAEVSALQPTNARAPMFVTIEALAYVTFPSPVQSSNALSLMLVTYAGIRTSVSVVR